jgi:hypothetical protein
MQLPDEVRKLVCFVHASGGGKEWLGTGFFVFEPLGVPNERGEEQSAIYIVTAKHCVKQYAKDKNGAPEPPIEKIEIRLNTVTGGSEKIDTTLSDWKHHPTADVSVYAFAPDRSIYDYLYYPARSWAGPIYGGDAGSQAHVPDVGPGTEIFLTGLLVYHPGKTRMMPIIRVGNIAAFPEEPIKLVTGTDHVVLIESRSLGGLSGSPVFVHFPPWRYDEATWTPVKLMPPAVPGNAGPNYLLGVVHGIWPTSGQDPDGIASAEPGLNAGITIVTPIHRALDLIDGPDLKPQREALKKHLEEAVMPTMTSEAAATTSMVSEFDRFEDLTGKLVQVSKPEK